MKYRWTIAVAVLAAVMLTGCGNPAEKGTEYLEEEKYEEAAAEFQKAVDDNKNAGDAYRGIGIAKWELKDYEGAKEAFLEALKNGADKTGTIYNFIGCCDLKLKDPASALNYFNLGIDLEGNSEELNQEMRFNVIVAYEQSGDWESAEKKLTEYLKDYPDDEAAQKEMEFLKTR